MHCLLSHFNWKKGNLYESIQREKHAHHCMPNSKQACDSLFSTGKWSKLEQLKKKKKC